MSDSARPQRKPFVQQTFGDMLRSVLVLLAIIGALWAVSSVISPDDEATPVRAVDYRGELADAREMASFPVSAPHGLGARWAPTSVDLQRRGSTAHWHLGFLTPAREYVGLEQGDLDPRSMTAKYVGGLRRAGAVTIGGQPWRLFRGETDTALLRRDDGVVTIVVGTAPTDTLAVFARSLR